MSSKIEFGEAQRIQLAYDRIGNSISKVCKIIKQFSRYKQLPRIPASSLWNFKHGIVYPDHGWTLFPQTGAEEARICIPAWDGYDGESFDNSSVIIPFDFINMEEEELVKLLEEGGEQWRNG